MRLRVTRRAFADGEQIFRYLSRHSAAGARQVMAELDRAMERLVGQPTLGTQTDVDEVRVLFVGRYPYKVFYRLSGDEVQVLHIRHTARVPEELDPAAYTS